MSLKTVNPVLDQSMAGYGCTLKYDLTLTSLKLEMTFTRSDSVNQTTFCAPRATR